MPIIEMPVHTTILLDFAAWFVIHMGSAILTLNLPDRLFEHDSYLYRSREWERSGDIWQTLFRVRGWKDKLPDGATILKKGFPKKKLQGREPALSRCLHQGIAACGIDSLDSDAARPCFSFSGIRRLSGGS